MDAMIAANKNNDDLRSSASFIEFRAHALYT